VFKIAVSIQNPAKYDVRAVIRFLHAKGGTAAEIHRQLFSIYGEDVMKRQNVTKWCHEFEAGRSDVHYEGHPLSLMKSFKNDENIRADRRFNIDELHQECRRDDEVQEAVMTWLREQAGLSATLEQGNSFPGSLSALRSMVTMLNSK
jgi:hypothetical protein